MTTAGVRILVGVWLLATQDSPGQTAGGTVSGRVLDALGNPVPGVTVEAAETGGEQLATAVTDSVGAFSLVVTRAGRYNVRAVAPPGYVEPSPFENPRLPLLFDPESPTIHHVDLRIERAASLEGRLVISKTEAPVPNAQVRLLEVRTIAGKPSLLPMGQPVRTDKQGHFVFPEVSPATYLVEVSTGVREAVSGTKREVKVAARKPASGVQYRRTYWPGWAMGDFLPSFTVSAGQKGNIGTVEVDPAPQTEVRANLQFDGCEQNGTINVTWVELLGRTILQRATGSIGCGEDVLIHGVSPGTYALWASIGGTGAEYVDLPVSVTGEPVDIDHRASRLGWLSGVIVMPDSLSSDFSAITVRAYPISGTPTLSEAQPASVDSKGVFRLLVRPNTEYELYVLGLKAPAVFSHLEHDGARALATFFTTKAGVTNETLRVVLSGRLDSIAGDVRIDDKLASGVNVFAGRWPPVLRQGHPVLIHGKTGENGQFSFDNLPAGGYRVFALRDMAKYLRGTSTEVLSLLSGGTSVETGEAARQHKVSLVLRQ